VIGRRACISKARNLTLGEKTFGEKQCRYYGQ
jgi:hypothetical protein